MNNEEMIAREILRRRVKESMDKRDHIHVTLPLGTKEIIMELTEEKPSTFCSKAILKYIEELSKE